MSLARRLSCVAALLAFGVACQFLLLDHLQGAGESPFPELRQPLEQFPLELPAGKNVRAGEPSAVWEGQEHRSREAVAKQVPFADALLYRVYRPRGERQQASGLMYLVYSRQGEDRKHHPEICMREAAGAPEDLSARAEVPLSDESRLAQRFRFRVEGGRYMNIYYWHYTFPPRARAEGDTPLRFIHRTSLTSPPSISVQVSSYSTGADLDTVERSLLPAIDRTLQASFLPENVLVGSGRIAVTLLRR